MNRHKSPTRTKISRDSTIIKTEKGHTGHKTGKRYSHSSNLKCLRTLFGSTRRTRYNRRQFPRSASQKPTSRHQSDTRHRLVTNFLRGNHVHRNPHGSRNPRKHKIRKHKRHSTTRMKPSSRYILDKPQTTEESFSTNFEEAMNILHSISPVRGISMTLQREKEDTTEQGWRTYYGSSGEGCIKRKCHKSHWKRKERTSEIFT